MITLTHKPYLYISDQFQILILSLPSGVNSYPGGMMVSSNQFVCEGSLPDIISVTGGVTDTSFLISVHLEEIKEVI